MNEEIEQTDDPQAESNESAPPDMRGYRLNITLLNINMAIYAAMFVISVALCLYDNGIMRPPYICSIWGAFQWVGIFLCLFATLVIGVNQIPYMFPLSNPQALWVVCSRAGGITFLYLVSDMSFLSVVFLQFTLDLIIFTLGMCVAGTVILKQEDETTGCFWKAAIFLVPGYYAFLSVVIDDLFDAEGAMLVVTVISVLAVVINSIYMFFKSWIATYASQEEMSRHPWREKIFNKGLMWLLAIYCLTIVSAFFGSLVSHTELNNGRERFLKVWHLVTGESEAVE